MHAGYTQLTLEQCLSNTGLLMLLLHVMMTNESKHTNVFINVTNMKYINLDLSREGEGRGGIFQEIKQNKCKN